MGVREVNSQRFQRQVNVPRPNLVGRVSGEELLQPSGNSESLGAQGYRMVTRFAFLPMRAADPGVQIEPGVTHCAVFSETAYKVSAGTLRGMLARVKPDVDTLPLCW